MVAGGLMIIICAALEQPVSSVLFYQPLKHCVSWSPDLSWAPAWTHCVSGDLVLHCSPLLGHTQHMESCPRSCSLIPQTRTDQHCLTMSDLPPAQRNTVMKSFYQVIAFFNTPVVVFLYTQMWSSLLPSKQDVAGLLVVCCSIILLFNYLNSNCCNSSLFCLGSSRSSRHYYTSLVNL